MTLSERSVLGSHFLILSLLIVFMLGRKIERGRPPRVQLVPSPAHNQLRHPLHFFLCRRQKKCWSRATAWSSTSSPSGILALRATCRFYLGVARVQAKVRGGLPTGLPEPKHGAHDPLHVLRAVQAPIHSSAIRWDPFLAGSLSTTIGYHFVLNHRKFTQEQPSRR